MATIETHDATAGARRREAPPRHCDIVMKGGITSGVVYPLAAVELSKHYTFKNVGGASAGAIAAACVAAAEDGRQCGGAEASTAWPSSRSGLEAT